MLLLQSFYGLNKVKTLQKNCLHTGQCLNFGTTLIGFNPSTKMLISSMILEASDMQVSIVQSPFKFFCHGMQINMPAINKSIMILRASAASWHLFWSHNLWMPGRSIHSRCPMTLCFWMCLIGYGTSLDLKTNLSPGKHNILFWTFIPFWAIGLSIDIHFPWPLSLSNIWNFHNCPPPTPFFAQSVV